MMWNLALEGDRNPMPIKRETGKFVPGYVTHQLAGGEATTPAMGRPAGVRLGRLRDNHKT